MPEAHDFIRHFLATLAYRFQKAVRGAPPDFGAFAAGSGVRTPLEIVRHMTQVLSYAKSTLDDSQAPKPEAEIWEHEILGFHQTLGQFDALLKNDLNKNHQDLLILLQGPLSDIMTHIGQLAMLRRLAGSAVHGESFIRADIKTGEVGPEQPPPRRPFES